MSVRARLGVWLRALAGPADPPVELPPRHERREEARERHAEGGPDWSESDRHLNPDGEREVSDVAPGLPGYGPSRRTVGRRG